MHYKNLLIKCIVSFNKKCYFKCINVHSFCTCELFILPLEATSYFLGN